MRFEDLHVEEDIRAAETLPGWFYGDAGIHDLARERVFRRGWHLMGDVNLVRTGPRAHPLILLEGYLDEPLVLTRDEQDRMHCLSNVCTHRGHLVVREPGPCRGLRCRYHGRRFALDGRFQSMPEFEGVCNFPGPGDDLAPVRLEQWGPLLFASVDPAMSFQEWLEPVRRRMDWMPLDHLVLDPGRCRDYLVQANWALYCDNYLEGFHIPFVHEGLATQLDYGSYRTELFRYGNLQVGIARGGEHVFDLPATSPDHGQEVAGYYFWLFPNLMLNFYPWGLSINLVRPLAPDRTKVSYLGYVLDPSKLERGAGAGLDRVEREDEEVVEAVQRGVRSSMYDRGRYSPAREQGVHHFHRLLLEFLQAPGPATAPPHRR